MDSLFAKADAIQPLGKKRKSSHPQKKAKDASDRTLHSVAQHTSIPKSFSKLPEAQGTYQHIANKKLRNELNCHTAQASRAKALQEDAEMLLMDEAGTIELEGEMERTWRVGQDEIMLGAGQEAAKGRREWKLDGGPYRARYTRNGRCVDGLTLCAWAEISTDTSLSRDARAMSRRLTGSRALCIRSCSFRRRAETSRRFFYIS